MIYKYMLEFKLINKSSSNYKTKIFLYLIKLFHIAINVIYNHYFNNHRILVQNIINLFIM